MDQSVAKKLLELERRLDRLAWPELGPQVVYLATPYTNANFNGDSFSDVAANTKIENTDWSTTIPTTAKALLLRCAVRDSGSAGETTCQLQLYSAAAAATASAVVPVAGVANDAFHEAQVIVPCTDGDIWYQIAASGANTFDVWLWLIGYWV